MPRLNAEATLRAMAEKKALVHHITNWVTINDCAQIVRHWGCLPVMAHAVDEVAEMAGLAGTLVLNIGTLTPELVESMLVAAKAANTKGIPVVVDAVGAGATRLRTNESKRLLEEAKVDILKGNAGEIATLAGCEAEVRGVESIAVEGDVGATAKALAATLGNVVAVTGEVDVVSDGKRVFTIKGGHAFMGRVVGTGCIGTSTVGCFATAGGDLMERASEALACFGLAGERAAKTAKGPGDFMGAFFNEIVRISERPTGIKFDVEESA